MILVRRSRTGLPPDAGNVVNVRDFRTDIVSSIELIEDKGL